MGLREKGDGGRGSGVGRFRFLSRVGVAEVCRKHGEPTRMMVVSQVLKPFHPQTTMESRPAILAQLDDLPVPFGD